MSRKVYEEGLWRGGGGFIVEGVCCELMVSVSGRGKRWG